MSAEVVAFPGPQQARVEALRRLSQAAALRYLTRAEETVRLLATTSNELERTTLCEIAEAWLDLAEAALPLRA